MQAELVVSRELVDEEHAWGTIYDKIKNNHLYNQIHGWCDKLSLPRLTCVGCVSSERLVLHSLEYHPVVVLHSIPTRMNV